MRSDARLAQVRVPPVSMHSVRPSAQPKVHEPLEQISSLPHVRPHAPQLRTSVCNGAHVGAAPPCAQSVCPVAQPGTHIAPWHRSPAMHVRPHAPQFPGSVLVLTQRSPHATEPSVHVMSAGASPFGRSTATEASSRPTTASPTQPFMHTNRATKT
jgi:hypothetical protein